MRLFRFLEPTCSAFRFPASCMIRCALPCWSRRRSHDRSRPGSNPSCSRGISVLITAAGLCETITGVSGLAAVGPVSGDIEGILKYLIFRTSMFAFPASCWNAD